MVKIMGIRIYFLNTSTVLSIRDEIPYFLLQHQKTFRFDQRTAPTIRATEKGEMESCFLSELPVIKNLNSKDSLVNVIFILTL